MGAIQIFTQLFQKADQIGKYLLLYVMDDFIFNSRDRDGYGYPELFWPVLESNILFEFTDISDVGRLVGGFLCRTGGVQVTRSYLIHTLLSDDKTKHTNAFMGFYATGHTLESLRIVVKVAPKPNESNAQLFVLIYRDAYVFFATHKDLKLTNDDKAVFTAFFTLGLSSPNSFVIDSCQEALAVLGEMTI